MKTILISILISFSMYAYSSEEDYLGKYTSINNGVKIEFTLNEEGVSGLIINNVRFDSKALTHDYLATYGNSQVFQINFEDNKTMSFEIKLFIVKNEGEFVIASGYYMQYKLNDQNKLVILKKQTVEFNYKKLQTTTKSTPAPGNM